MNISTIKYFSTVNGDGFRTAVFVSGCRLHCKGCFNYEAWDFNHGVKLIDEIIDKILESIEPDYIKGLSILGGDPFEPENQQTVYELCKIAKACYRQKDIWAWTGFMWEDIQNSHILDYVDVLVDGPFILEQKDLCLAYRGSRNQRVIDVKKSRVANGVVQLEGDWR